MGRRLGRLHGYGLLPLPAGGACLVGFEYGLSVWIQHKGSCQPQSCQVGVVSSREGLVVQWRRCQVVLEGLSTTETLGQIRRSVVGLSRIGLSDHIHYSIVVE